MEPPCHIRVCDAWRTDLLRQSWTAACRSAVLRPPLQHDTLPYTELGHTMGALVIGPLRALRAYSGTLKPSSVNSECHWNCHSGFFSECHTFRTFRVHSGHSSWRDRVREWESERVTVWRQSNWKDWQRVFWDSITATYLSASNRW